MYLKNKTVYGIVWRIYPHWVPDYSIMNNSTSLYFCETEGGLGKTNLRL